MGKFISFVEFCNSNPFLILLVLVVLLVMLVFLLHVTYGTPLTMKVLFDGITREMLTKSAKSALREFFKPWKYFKSLD